MGETVDAPSFGDGLLAELTASGSRLSTFDPAVVAERSRFERLRWAVELPARESPLEKEPSCCLSAPCATPFSVDGRRANFAAVAGSTGGTGRCEAGGSFASQTDCTTSAPVTSTEVLFGFFSLDLRFELFLFVTPAPLAADADLERA